MIYLITGASHTGKTLLAQRLLERLHIPYLSLDHLKMGLIRSGRIGLTPEEDRALTDCLWPIVREILKTALENRQNLILEGCYVPFDWQEDFTKEELQNIRFCCLVMGEDAIRKGFDAILAHANVIEQRLKDDGFTPEEALRDNAFYRAGFLARGCPVSEIPVPYGLDGILERLCRD